MWLSLARLICICYVNTTAVDVLETEHLPGQKRVTCNSPKGNYIIISKPHI